MTRLHHCPTLTHQRRAWMRSLIALALCGMSHTAMAQTGTWKAYMAYAEPSWIEQSGNMLYVLASNGLYAYNTNDKSIHTYDKVNGLSDCNIAHIGWNRSASKLVVVYQNGNIDLIDAKDNIVNLSDYYSKALTADKTINDLYQHDEYCYLSTGFGIVQLNVSKAEITNTFNLGFGVNYCYIQGDYIYAESKASGQYRALLTDNLLDKSVWKRIGAYQAQQKEMDADLLATVKTLAPGGPKYNYFGFSRFTGGKLYTAGGSNVPYREGTIQILDTNGNWTIYDDDTTISDVTGMVYVDVYCLDVDPNDATTVYAGARNGLYKFVNGHLAHFYNHENSPISIYANTTNPEYELVTTVKTDSEGGLYLFNSTSANTSLLYLKNNSWTANTYQPLMNFNGASLADARGMMFDSRGLLWFVNNNYTGPGLFCYQPSSDGLLCFTSFVNEDGTNVAPEYVRCVAEDAEHNIWIGTNKGPLMLESDQITADDAIFNQWKVARNDGTNLADYLLDGVDITAIAIDGGGRKWFGTNGNGLYLVSADNNTQIHHFLSSNSSLLSDNIESLSINPSTGEVYIGTTNGLCSYMSDATQPVEKMTKETTYAYPNPVRPDYKGDITIVGLSYQADVKIVTAAGALVAEGTSNGGTFVWDGNDLSGKRVASGVYFVCVATAEGDSGVVCKVAVIN